MNIIQLSKDDTHFTPTAFSREDETYNDPFPLHQQQLVRSLDPSIIPTRCKSELKRFHPRRNSTSSMSRKSADSSLTSRWRSVQEPSIPNLINMPTELFTMLCSYLDQQGLHALQSTHSKLLETSTKYLYEEPRFSSPYRLAQFTWAVSHKSAYGPQVIKLDLSGISTTFSERNGDLKDLAGWREFKYRNHDCHWQACTPWFQELRGTKSGTHPVPSPFLKAYSKNRDFPIGGLCHILKACPSIRYLNLSTLKFSGDFKVNHQRLFPPTAATNLIFVSDVPKSWTWATNYLKAVYADDIIGYINNLEHLEVFKARNAVWVTTLRLENIINNASLGLKRLDFRESGQSGRAEWAIKGSRQELRTIIKGLLKGQSQELSYGW